MGMTERSMSNSPRTALSSMQAQVDALIAGLGPVTDLLVLSHGWNNDKADASQLYDELLGNIDKLLDLRESTIGARDAAGFRRSPARAQFRRRANLLAEQEVHRCGADSGRRRGQRRRPKQENIAAVDEWVLDRPQGGPAAARRSRTRIPDRVEAMERAKALLPQLATSPRRRNSSSCCARCSIRRWPKRMTRPRASSPAAPETLFANAAAPSSPRGATVAAGGAGMTSGGAAGLGDLLSGVQAAARRIANFATYYQMKSRAGTVGSTGVADMLRRVRTQKHDHSDSSRWAQLRRAARHGRRPRPAGEDQRRLREPAAGGVLAQRPLGRIR